jgi:hypothetical protein
MNKKNIKQIILCIVMAVSYASCANNNEDIILKSKDKCYYYFNEMICLTEIVDKIFIRFSPDIDTKQITDIISKDNSLQLIEGTFCDEGTLRFAALESKNGKAISLSSLESIKKRPEVISVTYMLKWDRYYHGLMDEFVVKLKETTSYAQLELLTEDHNCKIGKGEEFHLVKNQYTLHVSKNSESDAMQMSRLFYETSLFEFSEPNLVVLHTANY